MSYLPFFGDIVIQSKDDELDWRGFVHCRDEEGNEWELHSCGKSPEEAAEQGWKRYLDRPNWKTWGCLIKRKNEEQKQCHVNAELGQVLFYETYGSWWAGYVPADTFFGNLVARYLVWKAKRKLKRIQRNL